MTTSLARSIYSSRRFMRPRIQAVLLIIANDFAIFPQRQAMIDLEINGVADRADAAVGKRKLAQRRMLAAEQKRPIGGRVIGIAAEAVFHRPAAGHRILSSCMSRVATVLRLEVSVPDRARRLELHGHV